MLKRLLLATVLLWAFAAQATVYSLPWGPKPQFVDANGAPMSSGTLTFYAAGSTTPQNTYTDSTGGVANSNPMTLNTRGETTTEVWLTGGQTYKLLLKDSLGVTVWTVDNISGVNDITVSNAPSEWIAGPTPTYVSATQFTLAGDQTVIFTVGRRVRTTNSGGTVYSTISASVFGAVTTVTLVNDASALDSGLSAVSYGMLASSNQSAPPATDVYPQFENNTDKTKRLTVSLSGITTGTIRTATAPDSNFNLGAPRGYIDGYTLSTAGSSATMAIAAGVARDSTNVADISLAASISKTTSSFTVGTGNGCLDTGAIANSTWYYFYAVLRADTAVVDILCSVSTSAPTMPANYSYKRYIGAGKTNGSAQWTSFLQVGDEFRWLATVLDVSTTTLSTTRTSSVLTVPLQARVVALGNIMMSNASGGVFVYVSAADQNDEAPSASAAPLASISIEGAGTSTVNGPIDILTNASGQISYRASAANTSFRWATLGWRDQRGKNQ